jgi:hypothetical protein
MTGSLPHFPDEQQTLRSLVDKFIESWVCWREACEAVHSAYARWQQCEAAQRGLAFEGYWAALDREDQAAQVHSMRAGRVREARNGCRHV